MLNRFIQPDTIVPEIYNPQMFNRFSYVGNNPVNFNDPTGHKPQCAADGYCGSSNKTNFYSKPKKCNAACKLDLKFEGDWEEDDQNTFVAAALTEAQRMYDVYCPVQRRFDCEFLSAEALYRATHGTTTLTFNPSSQGFYCQRNANVGQEGVSCYENSRGDIDPILAAHEMGHVFNALIANNGYTTPYNSLATDRKKYLPNIGDGITSGYKSNKAFTDGEDFGNMYSMWVFNDFDTSKPEEGIQRKEYMNKHMYTWIVFLLDNQ